MIKEIVNDFRIGCEHVGNQVLLFSVNEEGHKFCEVSSKDWVDWSVSGLNELKESIK